MPIKGQRRDKTQFTFGWEPQCKDLRSAILFILEGLQWIHHNNKKGFRENEITAAKKPPVSYLFDCDSANPLRRKGGDSNNKIMSANLSSKVISATIFLPTSSSRPACHPYRVTKNWNTYSWTFSRYRPTEISLKSTRCCVSQRWQEGMDGI